MDSPYSPLAALMDRYCSEYASLRSNNLELSHTMFHKKYGLTISCPHHWDMLSSIDKTVKLHVEEFNHKIGVIYSTTSAYKRIREVLGDNVQYMSWSEIYTAMHLVQSDVRYMAKITQMLRDAELTFFIDPPPLPEVINQVCGHAANCLIIISGNLDE